LAAKLDAAAEAGTMRYHFIWSRRNTEDLSALELLAVERYGKSATYPKCLPTPCSTKAKTT